MKLRNRATTDVSSALPLALAALRALAPPAAPLAWPPGRGAPAPAVVWKAALPDGSPALLSIPAWQRASLAVLPGPRSAPAPPVWRFLPALLARPEAPRLHARLRYPAAPQPWLAGPHSRKRIARGCPPLRAAVGFAPAMPPCAAHGTPLPPRQSPARQCRAAR